MTPLLLVKYLGGDVKAIRQLAASRWTLLVGAVLVFSASLARNYDGKALPQEGEALLHGIVVSTANAFVLFSIFYLFALWRRGPRPRPPFARGYLAFLGLFWMTAPMAWLYAIPYERMVSPIDAINFNLLTLAVVSLWRVLLMSLVLRELWRTKLLPTLLVVLLYADVQIFIAANVMKAPVFDFMGGLQHSPVDQHLASLRFDAGVFSFLAAPVLLIAALIGLKWLWLEWRLERKQRDERPSRALLLVAALSVVAWVPALWATQPEQHNRFKAEAMLRKGRIGEAFAFMANKGRGEFPPVWDPPPRVSYLERTPNAQQIREALRHYNGIDWVSDVYFGKHWLLSMRHRYQFDIPPRLIDSIERDFEYRDELDDAEKACFLFHAEHDPSLSSATRDALRRLLAKFPAHDESAFFEELGK